MAMDLERILENLGYGVVSIASTGKEAIQKAGEFGPDLVLTGIVFEGRYGRY